MFDIEVGVDGCDMTYQEEFPEVTPCCKCGCEARVAVVLVEDHPKEGSWICELHQDPDKFWPHDCAAFAIYLCTSHDCAAATTLWNQA